jgi:hypothetical protein
MTLKHATWTQFAARFRARFRDAEQVEVWRLAALVKMLLNEGYVTVAQLRAAFDLTAAEMNALSSRIDGYVTKYYELKNARGE